MRHSKRRHKLGVSGPHRSAMMGNLAVALITHGRIQTTISKAKALRPFIEKIITLAKKAEKANDAARKLHYRRLAISRVRDKAAVAKLFDERASEFTERSGGYTRIYKVGQRLGDATEMALIELIDGNDEGYSKQPAKKAAKKATKKAAAKVEAEDEGAPTTEEAEAPAAEVTEVKAPAKKAAKKVAKKAEATEE
jgi:large subunit ribosomal protein L17